MNTEIPAIQKLTDKIKSSGDVLVTVAKNPTVDALAAAIGLTLALDKLDKRATAVFSGEIPDAINFLEPDKTFESNADSLRDFIISLDKDKADRLRFKPDGDKVRIYITPYKTKLTADDLSFSDGDFNVELVVAIGVNSREDLDEAIASHGRILHSAITATVGIDDQKDQLGAISWQNEKASSYSEMIDDLIAKLTDDKDFIDTQIATALLTGLVSATDQFRNAKTSSVVMTMAANLMAKGANQQLIASELSGEESKTEIREKSAPEQGMEVVHNLEGSEKWNQVQDQATQITNENERFANEENAKAIEKAENQLREVAPPTQTTENAPISQNTQNISVAENREKLADNSEQSTAHPAPAPLSAPKIEPAKISEPKGSAELDNLIANATSSATATNDLRATAKQSTEVATTNLSHGEPYINSSVAPMNSSLLGEDTTISNVPAEDSGFAKSSELSIAPPAPEIRENPVSPTQNSSSPDEKIPTIPPAPQTQTAPTATFPNPAPTDIDGLPPVPPLAPPNPNQNSDITSLTQTAANLAEPETAKTPEIPEIAPNNPAPLTPAPMISQQPTPPAQDPTQFQIPGM